MKYTELGYDEAHRVVDSNRYLKWDGWNIVTWRRDPRGYSDTRGAWRGSWGIQFTYPLTPDGTWLVPSQYVERVK